jgi:2-polyprenyl-3-methyl-5-hydroxy-6-metoxy-1,4-benzoquinol methylase
MEQNSALIFSENWSIYQKIILHNYMHHAEFANKAAAVFEKFSSKKLHILDMGCGDVIPLLLVLQQVQIESYTGYDLSSSALQLASMHLAAQNFAYTLREGNMTELIQKEEKKFDIIHSSFAIHHLQDDEKRKLLRTCFNRLLPGGKMVYTDIFRQQYISRHRYIDEYFSFIENDWPLLTINEKQLVYEHIHQYDFPSDIEETIGGLHSLGCPIIETYQPDHRHAMLVLIKE